MSSSSSTPAPSTRTWCDARPCGRSPSRGSGPPAYRDQEIADEIAEVADLVPNLLNLGLAPGSGVATHTGSGAVMNGGGAGPELQIVAMPTRDADAAGVRLMTATLKTLLADLPLLAERADSVEITVRRP